VPRYRSCLDLVGGITPRIVRSMPLFFGLLEPVPGARGTCSLMRPGVDRGEEVAADQRDQRERATDEDREARDTNARAAAHARPRP